MNKLVDRLRGEHENQMRAGKPASEAWAEAKDKVSLDRTGAMLPSSKEVAQLAEDSRKLVVKTADPAESLRADQALVRAGIASTTYRNDMGVFRTYVQGADAQRANAVILQAEARYQSAQKQQEQAKAGMGMGIGL